MNAVHTNRVHVLMHRFHSISSAYPNHRSVNFELARATCKYCRRPATQQTLSHRSELIEKKTPQCDCISAIFSGDRAHGLCLCASCDGNFSTFTATSFTEQTNFHFHSASIVQIRHEGASMERNLAITHWIICSFPCLLWRSRHEWAGTPKIVHLRSEC